MSTSFTGNNKLYRCWVKPGPVYVYVHAASLKQAAIAAAIKSGVKFVKPDYCKEMPEQKVYRAWYIKNLGCRTTYIYIVSNNINEAWTKFFMAGYTKMYDFSHKNVFVEKPLSEITTKFIANGIYQDNSEVVFYN